MNKFVAGYKDYRLRGLIQPYDPYTTFSILDKKVKSVIRYIKDHNIKNVVVGFSGGADSTLVLLILCLAKKEYDFNIHAISVMSLNPKESSFGYAQLGSINNINTILDNVIHEVIHYTHSNSLIKAFQGWNLSDKTIHQSYYQSMYNILFTYAQHVGGITVGTTNMDELSYVGWFGKNSDMMVDLQIISDFHKFEVFEILRYYQISIDNPPSGDIPNGFTDEEYFGTDYDTLSYYTYCKCVGIPSDLTLPLVEQLHKDNYHKYLGQSFNPIFIIDKDRFHIYKNPKFNYHKVT